MNCLSYKSHNRGQSSCGVSPGKLLHLNVPSSLSCVSGKKTSHAFNSHLPTWFGPQYLSIFFYHSCYTLKSLSGREALISFFLRCHHSIHPYRCALNARSMTNLLLGLHALRAFSEQLFTSLCVSCLSIQHKLKSVEFLCLYNSLFSPPHLIAYHNMPSRHSTVFKDDKLMCMESMCIYDVCAQTFIALGILFLRVEQLYLRKW